MNMTLTITLKKKTQSNAEKFSEQRTWVTLKTLQCEKDLTYLNNSRRQFFSVIKGGKTNVIIFCKAFQCGLEVF